MSTKYSQYDPKKVNLSIVVIKSLILGILVLINITLLINKQLQNFKNIQIFIIAISNFHFLEFLSTCLFNNSETDDDSFILNDQDLHFVYIVSIIENITRFYLLNWFKISIPFNFTWLGIILIIMGQFIRTLSMYTAQESFNHYIQRSQSDNHILVTNGIYLILRHPSYFGYFWWFIGLQVLLGNPIILLGGGWKIWWFFKKRIEFEEKYLINFFKEDYVNYKRRTHTWIPFIQ